VTGASARGLTRGGSCSVHPESTRGSTRPAGLAGYVEDVFNAFAKRWDPTAPDPGVARAFAIVRAIGLVVILVTVIAAKPHPGTPGRGILIAIALAVCTVAWVVWMFADFRSRATVISLCVAAVAIGLLPGLSPNSAAVAGGMMIAAHVGARYEPGISIAITAAITSAFLGAGLAVSASTGFLIGYTFGFIGCWTIGYTRRAYVLRTEEAERTLAETRRAREAETQAAALAERARIAREIHDVLAHSLAAVSVNLQAAEGLLGSLPAGSPELAKAIECVGRAGAFTREGLAEARRAILALRDDAAPSLLSDQLAALAEEYRTDGDLVDFSVVGEPRPVPAEARLTAYRAAQEALTNARKHAPGQPVRLSLSFSPSEVGVEAVNPLPGSVPAGELAVGRGLAASGAGYGLTGLRERAALADGTLTAGPAGGEWRVSLRIPA
jgi:signal transduction histidine kinase